MRILGKGKTALAIKEVFPNSKMYDDNDKELFDINSNELTVVSPGIPPYNYLVQNSKNIASDYDLFLNDDMFTIWISGTNGKTTTTSMLYHLLKDSGALCGGNIGIPLGSLSKEKDILKSKIILETSSFTLHYTNKAKPNIYILLPISEDHISWHGTYQEYVNSKLKPLSLMSKDDIAIIPIKHKDYKSDANVIYYNDANDLASTFEIDIEKVNFKEPFLTDSLLALTVEKIVNSKISYDKINQFSQDPHKIEEFIDSRKRLWVDDSKATNVDATIQAVKTYKDKNINIILGGDDKGANLEPLFEYIKDYSIKVYAIGKNTDKLANLSNEYNIKHEKSYTLEEAVKNIIANENGQKASVSLLSPAAASLDQFTSYKHRGDEFKRFVKLFNN